MKTVLLFSFMISTHLLIAQAFREVPLLTALDDVVDSSVAFADVNGDTYSDALITGNSRTGSKIAKLYINDGTGKFAEMDTPFQGVSDGMAAFSDVNGDTYPDVFIAGDFVAKLYLNDGVGNFTEVMDTPFIPDGEVTFAFSDINDDTYPDLLLLGVSGPYLYINDGIGNFSEADISIENLRGPALAVFDVNGDTYPDILLSGSPGIFSTLMTKLYTNDGTGTFTEVMNTSFIGVLNGHIAVSDVNGDTYPDVFIAGDSETELYLNDGMGSFTPQGNAPLKFDGVDRGAIDFSDVNGDTYPDLLMTGRAESSFDPPVARLFTNDGAANFTEIANTPFTGVAFGALAFSDVNDDTYPDVLITGQSEASFPGDGPPNTQLYINDGAGNFTAAEVINSFEPVTEPALAFADVNGDDFPDILIAGEGTVNLSLNDGEGNFAIAMDTPFEGIENAALVFADVNKDTFPDVLITGRNRQRDLIAKLYLNDGEGNFTEVMDTPFEGVDNGALAFADVNGDTYPDALITGRNRQRDGIAKLYFNDGEGNFTEVMDTPFEGVEDGALAFADVNGDTYTDVLITGFKSEDFTRIAGLYLNDGTGNFSEVMDTPFAGINRGALAFADVNDDTHPDVLIIGFAQFSPVANLYINDGAGNFTEVMDTPFPNVVDLALAFADVNDDTHPDVLIIGSTGGEPIAKMYINDGIGNFTELSDVPFQGVVEGALALTDVNGDMLPDVLITGETTSRDPILKLYVNEGLITSVLDQQEVASSVAMIYPNPGLSDRIMLRYDALHNSPLQIQIFDVNGRLKHVQQEIVAAGRNDIQLRSRSLSKGTYLIQLSDDRHTRVLKLLIQ